MKFNEKLVLIMKYLNITNIELAKVCKFDPTIISRYRSGNRIPTQNSSTLSNLVCGICSIVLEQNKENKICELFSRKNVDLFSSIMDWFCEDESSIRLSKNKNGLIGENLTTLMKLFNITNVELAKYLNKDYSLISKYRNNVTILLKTDKTSEKICNYFIEIGYKNDSINLITSLLGIDVKSSNDTMYAALNEYLFYNKRASSPIDNFLGNLNEFKYNSEIALPILSKLVPDEILNDKRQTYVGTDEFRYAVKKFLECVIINPTSTTLNLYSDENMKWMTGNKAFYDTMKANILHF